MNDLKYLNTSENKAVACLVSKLKRSLNDQLIKIKIFGSKIRGDYHQDSDIDILVIVRERTEEILDKVAEISLEVDLIYDSHISIMLFSEDEYQQNKGWETPFIQNVEREGLLL